MNTPTVRSCNCRRCAQTEAQASPRPTPPAVGDGTTSTGGEGSSLSPAPGAPNRTVPDQGLGGNLREQDSVGLELGTPQGPSADFERFVRQLDTGHGAPRRAWGSS